MTPGSPLFSAEEWQAIYHFIESEQGVRRADVTQFLMTLRPGLTKEEATLLAGTALTTLHNAGFAIRNNLYYALTEAGRKQIVHKKE